MFRFAYILITFISFGLIVPGTGGAEYLFRDGAKIDIQWYEREGKILNGEVCFNYKEDRVKYRQCRKKAIDYFKDECRFYTKKAKKAPEKYREMYEPEKVKFCTASETYEP